LELIKNQNWEAMLLKIDELIAAEPYRLFNKGYNKAIEVELKKMWIVSLLYIRGKSANTSQQL